MSPGVTSLKCLQGWSPHHFLWHLVPVLGNPLGEGIFLILNLNLLWCNLRLFPLVLSLISWEKILTPTTTSFQAVEESDMVTPEPPFFESKHPCKHLHLLPSTTCVCCLVCTNFTFSLSFMSTKEL